jgi:hypothetical protein
MEAVKVDPARPLGPPLLPEVDPLDEDRLVQVRLAEVVAPEVVAGPTGVQVLGGEAPGPSVEAALRDRSGEGAVDELGAGRLPLVEVRVREGAALETSLARIGLRQIGVVEPAVAEDALDRTGEQWLPLPIKDEAAEIAVDEDAGLGGESREGDLPEVDILDRRAPDVDDAAGGVDLEGYVRVPAGTERPGVSWPSCDSFGAFWE